MKLWIEKMFKRGGRKMGEEEEKILQPIRSTMKEVHDYYRKKQKEMDDAKTTYMTECSETEGPLMSERTELLCRGGSGVVVIRDIKAINKKLSKVRTAKRVYIKKFKQDRIDLQKAKKEEIATLRSKIPRFTDHDRKQKEEEDKRKEIERRYSEALHEMLERHIEKGKKELELISDADSRNYFSGKYRKHVCTLLKNEDGSENVCYACHHCSLNSSIVVAFFAIQRMKETLLSSWMLAVQTQKQTGWGLGDEDNINVWKEIGRFAQTRDYHPGMTMYEFYQSLKGVENEEGIERFRDRQYYRTRIMSYMDYWIGDEFEEFNRTHFKLERRSFMTNLLSHQELKCVYPTYVYTEMADTLEEWKAIKDYKEMYRERYFQLTLKRLHAASLDEARYQLTYPDGEDPSNSKTTTIIESEDEMEATERPPPPEPRSTYEIMEYKRNEGLKKKRKLEFLKPLSDCSYEESTLIKKKAREIKTRLLDAYDDEEVDEAFHEFQVIGHTIDDRPVSISYKNRNQDNLRKNAYMDFKKKSNAHDIAIHFLAVIEEVALMTIRCQDDVEDMEI